MTSLQNKRTKNILTFFFESGVYQIDCKNCNKFYIGETGRPFEIRLLEHKAAARNTKNTSGLTNHCIKEKHGFDFDNAKLVFKNANTVKRKVVEAALISINKSNCVNLNTGFVPLDETVSSCISNNFNISLVNRAFKPGLPLPVD